MNSWRSITVGNLVNLDGQAGATGISCDSGNGMSRNNTLAGTPVGVSGCQSNGDFIDVN